MKVELLNLEKQKIEEVELNDSIFGLDVRLDLIKRVVDWQRNKAMSGTHKAKTISEISGTTKKPFKQKGTGNARQGSLRSVQMRGGAVAHGPRPRSHATKLQKKVRILGMRHALSLKMFDDSIYIVDSLDLSSYKTSDLAKSLSNFGNGKIFMIDGDKEVNRNLKLSSKSLPKSNAVPVIGANVYDIVNSDVVIISKSALPLLEERLK